MAAKINLMKMLQEIRGMAIFSSRRVPSRLPGLATIPWRTRAAGPGRKRLIRIDMQQAPADIPNPVKIVHLQSQSGDKEPSRASRLPTGPI